MLLSECRQKLLKPLDQADRSMREVEAYEVLRRSAIGPFICGFHGIRTVPGYARNYLVIDSAYAGMSGNFATMDIKIGKITWEDNASKKKIEAESAKFEKVYAKSTAKDGFRVAGCTIGELVLQS